MTYTEDEYLQLSGIQHFWFCRRQWALIHIEKQWAENEHTVVGELMHERAHDAGLREKRKGVLMVRALPISSPTMGVSGECDVVEFHTATEGVKLQGHRGLYRIYPIEYKKGRPKITQEDLVQLTAQVMCLEEMFSARIERGALYYGETRRREEIVVTEELRDEVRKAFHEMHEYHRRGYTPKVKASPKCKNCSLKDICMPALGKLSSAEAYIRQRLEEG